MAKANKKRKVCSGFNPLILWLFPAENELYAFLLGLPQTTP
jgi:hypothetical protein